MPRRGVGEPPTPLQHRRATSMDLAHAPWISPGWRRGPLDLRALGAPNEDAGVGEDAGHWCVAAVDEEHGRGKDGDEEAKGLVLFNIHTGGSKGRR